MEPFTERDQPDLLGSAKPPADSGEILIVEDSRTQAEQLRYLLERRGYATKVVASGMQALAAMRQHRPKLVLCDILMPEMNGYDLCQLIKGQPDWRDIPVVLLSSLNDLEDVFFALECGADSFICKPYNEHFLYARIDLLLQNPVPRVHGAAKPSVTLSVRGEQRTVHTEPQQLLDFLVSIYEQAIQLNKELEQQSRGS